MRTLFVPSLALALLTGCASMTVRGADPIPLAAAKVIARIPLGIATFGISELAIRDAECDRIGCVRSSNPDALGALLLLQNSRPAPVVFTPAHRDTCFVSNVGPSGSVVCY